MTVPFLDLARHYRGIRDEVSEAVTRTLERGAYILGEEVAALEREFAAYCGVAHGVGVASGTDAIALALRAYGVQPGDTVVTAPNTAVPTVSAIVAAGAYPAFVDVDPRTFTLDPTALRAYLKSSSRPRRISAVVAVHLYGHPADLGALGDIAGEFKLALIEDAAQAHGAEYDGRRVGGLGHAGCFSFYPTKNLGAFGDGGMVVTGDPGVAERLRMLRVYGEERKNLSRIEGVNSRLDELQAAILRVKLRHLDEWLAARRRLAEIYAAELAGTPLILPVTSPGARHAYHLYVVRAAERDALQEHLHEHGIGTSVHYPRPVHLQPAYARLGHGPGSFPEAERSSREVLSLPLYPELRDDEVQHVVTAIRSFFS